MFLLFSWPSPELVRSLTPQAFDVSPFKSAYINIFYVGEYESVILFPYDKNQDTYIEKNNNRRFNEFIASTDKELETGRLIIILTKDYYPFELSERDELGYYTKTNIASSQ